MKIKEYSNLVEIINRIKYSILFKNFVCLSFIQIANYLCPLIVLPYLSRTIGVEKFGVVSFAQSITMWFVAFTSIGFNFHVPRLISMLRQNIEKVRLYFWNVVYLRGLFSIIGCLIVIALIFTIEKFKNISTVIIFAYLYVFANVFYSAFWFFIGIEKMENITFINFLARALYTISIFILIKKAEHYIYVPLLFSLSEILAGGVALLIVMHKFKIFPSFVKRKVMTDLFKDSFTLGIAEIFGNISGQLPNIILGLVSTPVAVGYYTAAQKIYYAWNKIQNQLTVVLFPRISFLIKKDVEIGRRFIKKSLPFTVLFSFLGSFFIFFLSDKIVVIFFGKEFLPSIFILKMFSVAIIFVGLNNVFGIQIMIPTGAYKKFAFIELTGFLIFFLFCFLLVKLFNYNGAIFSYLFYLFFITSSKYFQVKKLLGL